MQPEFDGEKILKRVKKTENFSFAKNTTYGLGGTAKVAYFPESEEEAVAVYGSLKAKNDKILILGNGSNILAADKRFDISVISTKNLNRIYKREGCIYCQSGVTVTKLLNFCKANEIGGFEYLAGIPASVGGLALMNGGIPERHLGDDILSVKIFDGNLRNLDNKQCNFGNKYSTMRDIDCLILGVNLSICAVPREAIEKNIAIFLEKRLIQPRGKSCGCVFKNTKSASAGKLIDEAGLKGLKYGGAEVSREHANFIINNGASASDVYALIQTVKNKVYSLFGIRLDEEVIYIGDRDDFNG